MSSSVLGANAASGAVGAAAAAERMQQLQTLITQVERGPAGFAAALDAAQASSAATQATSAGVGESAASGASATAAAYTPSTAAYTSATEPYGTGAGADAAYTALGQSSTQSAVGYPSASVENAAATATAPVGSSATAAAGAGAGGAYVPLIEQAAARNGVDPAVLYGLIEQESGFDPNATSSAGALGLTQLMPDTASSLGVSEPLNPAQSIEGGARYLGQMLRQFGGNTTDALAAYNAGPGAVQQYGGVPPYPETQQYVSKVLANAASYGGSNASTGAPVTIA